MRNRVDRADIFPAVTCGDSACGARWRLWCHGCNSVYCADHADMEVHACKRTDEIRGIEGAGLVGKPKRKRKKRSEAAKETQLMLGDTPSGNGKTHG